VAQMQALVKAGEMFCGSNASIGQGWWEESQHCWGLLSNCKPVSLSLHAYLFLWLCLFIMEEKYIAEQLAVHMPINTVIWHFEELHRASNKCKNIVLDWLKWQNLRNCKLMERILTFLTFWTWQVGGHPSSSCQQLLGEVKVLLVWMCQWAKGCCHWYGRYGATYNMVVLITNFRVFE
jgi:hypothetical protein